MQLRAWGWLVFALPSLGLARAHPENRLTVPGVACPCPARRPEEEAWARKGVSRVILVVETPPIHAHHLTSITASLPSLLPTLRLPDVSLPLKHILNHPLLVSRHRNHSLFVTRGLKLSAVLLRVCAPCRSKGAIRSCAFATFQAIVSSSVYLLTTMISSDLE